MAKNIQDPGSIKYNDDDIEEVEAGLFGSENDVVNFGEITSWELSEVYEQLLLASEKAKIRRYVTGIVVSLWTICTSVCLIRLILTGDLTLIGLPTLISIPMAIILKFYYRSG
jgi:hypothetical protein